VLEGKAATKSRGSTTGKPSGLSLRFSSMEWLFSSRQDSGSEFFLSPLRNRTHGGLLGVGTSSSPSANEHRGSMNRRLLPNRHRNGAIGQDPVTPSGDINVEPGSKIRCPERIVQHISVAPLSTETEFASLKYRHCVGFNNKL
jgi:hypothetical protein